ncbi:MAG TPA: hypothetical protein VIY10_03320 [Solirubrobacteraceae bacterium]
MVAVDRAQRVGLGAALQQEPHDLRGVGRGLQLTLDLDPVGGDVVQQRGPVREGRAGALETCDGVEQLAQSVELAPLDRVGRRLEAEVDDLIRVPGGGGPVRVPVVPGDGLPRRVGLQRGGTASSAVPRTTPVPRRRWAATGLPRSRSGRSSPSRPRP